MMKYNRIFSVLICLVLVCALLISWSPIRAEAIAIVDDLAYAIGLAVVAILGTCGVVFDSPSQDFIRAIGFDFSDFMYSKADSDEKADVLDVTFGVWFDAVGGNGDSPKYLPGGDGLNTWFNFWLMQYLSEFVTNEKSVQVPLVSDPIYGTMLTPGEDFLALRYRSSSSYYSVGKSGVYYFGFYEPTDSGTGYSYCVGLCSTASFNFDSTSVSGSGRKYTVNGKSVYAFVSSSSYTFPLEDYEYANLSRWYFNDGTFTSWTGLAYSILYEGLLAETPTEAYVPTIVHSGIGGYFVDGGDPEDVVLPDLQLGNITISEGQTFSDALQALLQLLADGVITWQQYMDIVAPGVDITTSNGQVITDTGVQSDLTLPNLLTGLKTLFSNLANTILDGIKSIFVPSTDFLTDKVTALRERFNFADSIITTGHAIGDALNGFGTEPPIIYAELANAEGSIYWGERAVALDLRWYSRYKPTVDVLLSSVMWLFFAWRLFVHLPGIISGTAGFVTDTLQQDDKVQRKNGG